MTTTQITSAQVQDHIDSHITNQTHLGRRWLPGVWSEDDDALRAALESRLGSTVPSGYMSEECGWWVDEDEISEDMRDVGDDAESED